MTLLAFGNGAPDVFSALSAVQNMKNNDVGLLVGALLGISFASVCITSLQILLLFRILRLLQFAERFVVASLISERSSHLSNL